MPAIYYFKKGQIRPRSYQLYKKITVIGSEPDDDIVVDESSLKDSKLNIVFNGKKFVAEAVGRGIDFYYNNKRKKKAELEDGDILTVGKTVFLYTEADIKDTESKITKQEGHSLNLKKVIEISVKIMEEKSISKILNSILDTLIEALNADKGFIIMIESGVPSVKVARNIAGKDIPEGDATYSDSILNQVLTHGTPIIVSDALRDSRFSSSTSIMSLKLCSVIAAPLKYKGKTMGLVYLGNDNVVNLFTTEDLEFLTVVTALASSVIHNALLMNELEDKINTISKEMEEIKFGEIIGACDGMKKVFQRVIRIAPTDVNVLILGETGTGKELIANEIHKRSNRAKGPFVAINCGAIPENLLESELFGHVKGAFTGAFRTHEGKFQQANGGTLFLDEISELPLNLQVKLLRAIQERQVTKIGATKPDKVDIRIIAASNRNLQKEVEKGNFREDLYYRLNVITIILPPLRDRGDDVILIANYLLRKYNKEFNTNIKGFTQEAIKLLKRYSWPGNIRELENRMKRAVIFSQGPLLSPEDFEIEKSSTLKVLPLAKAKEDFQMAYILKILDMNSGNRTKTAEQLKVDPRTVFRYLEKEKEQGHPSMDWLKFFI